MKKIEYHPTALIGYTGFVGSNLKAQHPFDEYYNSKNIANIAGKNFDLVVCAGVSAVKWLANQEPAADLAGIETLKKQLSTIKTKHFVLVSTVDVYDQPNQSDEDLLPNADQQDFYGKHRYQLEQWVSEHFENHHIIRLPGLFGQNLKKNLIFDILNPLPKAINKNLWQTIQNKLEAIDSQEIKNSYTEDEFGNLKLEKELDPKTAESLAVIFAKASFSTLNFTDSRSIFQFYHLANLWKDIEFTLKNKIPVLNIAVEPISAAELVAFVLHRDFNNFTQKGGVQYDMYSKYAADKKYLYSKTDVLTEIKQFITTHKK